MSTDQGGGYRDDQAAGKHKSTFSMSFKFAFARHEYLLLMEDRL